MSDKIKVLKPRLVAQEERAKKQLAEDVKLALESIDAFRKAVEDHNFSSVVMIAINPNGDAYRQCAVPYQYQMQMLGLMELTKFELTVALEEESEG